MNQMAVRTKIILVASLLFTVTFGSCPAFAQFPSKNIDGINAIRKSAADSGQTKDFNYWAKRGQQMAAAHDYVQSDQCYENAYLMRLDHISRFHLRQTESYEEIHEVAMLLYLKALNYLETGDLDGALVECRRLDEWVHPRTKHDSERTLIQQDPLVYACMGLLYALNKDCDDASISYKRAEQIYRKDYRDLLGKHTPGIVKIDQLEPKQNQLDCSAPNGYGQLILIWNNGLSPEFRTDNDVVIVRRRKYCVANRKNVKLYRDVLNDTIPSFYKFSRPFYHTAELVRDGVSFPCELLSDVSWYEAKIVGKRLGIKGQHTWRKGINWNSMPGQISYSIVPLERGVNNFSFNMSGDGGVVKTDTFSVYADGRIYFHAITTPEKVAVEMNHHDCFVIPTNARQATKIMREEEDDHFVFVSELTAPAPKAARIYPPPAPRKK